MSMFEAATKEQTMSTIAKAQQVVINIHTLMSEGHTIDEAVTIIAKASHVEERTIVQAIGYALYA